MATEKPGSLAVLIDGDNASASIISGLITEIAKYGTASVRRIYGDWTRPNLSSWKGVLLDNSILPMQQFAYTKGKNATDGAMIIDAMDLLYTGRFSAFCLVSSDSDFTRLAARIREQGVTVYGFGERKTPKPFVSACDQFTYFDTLPISTHDDTIRDTRQTSPFDNYVRSLKAGGAVPSKRPHVEVPPGGATETDPKRMHRDDRTTTFREVNVPNFTGGFMGPKPLDQAAIEGLKQVVNSTAGEDNWANLANVGHFMRRVSPDLNAQNYGYARLRGFVEASGIVDVQQRELRNGPPVVVVRIKEDETR
ncbi:hypothetical protein K491DRAFT_698111 [Lophiostoma macrostomum CBS 122681]|uniref:HTH OST-type domain-containing protein n=1 Tax=Lophiostoma macrostomum CBS 122681 TaxID=1314788 RepID=A0A6A6SP62_9PLEO|nr:hypothetical protein K491DRAFT_698111 [Lophiostoma macrostomum CBS 122681]